MRGLPCLETIQCLKPLSTVRLQSGLFDPEYIYIHPSGLDCGVHMFGSRYLFVHPKLSTNGLVLTITKIHHTFTITSYGFDVECRRYTHLLLNNCAFTLYQLCLAALKSY